MKKHVYSKDYFCAQVNEFEKIMEKKEFWRDLDKTNLALKALFFVFNKVNIKEFDSEVEHLMLTAVNDYTQRMFNIRTNLGDKI
jgi:hypothetical protein